MTRLILAVALLCVSCSGTAQPTLTCKEERRTKEAAFIPLKAELETLRAEEIKLGGGQDGYPPLQLTRRYLELEEKMEVFHRTHPLAACEGTEPEVMVPKEGSNAQD